MAIKKNIYKLREACEEHGLKTDDALFLGANGDIPLYAYLDGWKALITTEDQKGESLSYERTLMGYRELRKEDIARIRDTGSPEILLLRSENSYGRISQHSNPNTTRKLPTVGLEDVCIFHSDLEQLLRIMPPTTQSEPTSNKTSTALSKREFQKLQTEQICAEWQRLATKLHKSNHKLSKHQIAKKIFNTPNTNPRGVIVATIARNIKLEDKKS